MGYHNGKQGTGFRSLNEDQEHFGNIQQARERTDAKATHCSSQKCNGGQVSNARGKLVAVNGYFNKCPICHSGMVFHDTVTRGIVEKFNNLNKGR